MTGRHCRRWERQARQRARRERRARGAWAWPQAASFDSRFRCASARLRMSGGLEEGDGEQRAPAATAGACAHLDGESFETLLRFRAGSSG